MKERIAVTTQHDERATRRSVLRAAVAAAAGIAAVPAEAQEKLAQSVVQYQTQPKEGKMCSTCVNFEPPAACKLVTGKIDPNGWCLIYAPKAYFFPGVAGHAAYSRGSFSGFGDSVRRYAMMSARSLASGRPTNVILVPGA
jgi:hypothetical protein